MRVRFALLAVVLALLVAIPSVAQTAAPATSQTPAFCAAALLAPQLPAANPIAPFFATTLCGSCSDTHCQGHNTGSICAAFGTVGHCFVNDVCSGGGQQCLCQTGND